MNWPLLTALSIAVLSLAVILLATSTRAHSRALATHNRILRGILEQPTPPRACRVCNCTDDDACWGGCWWVETDLCSSCADDAEAGR